MNSNSPSFEKKPKCVEFCRNLELMLHRESARRQVGWLSRYSHGRKELTPARYPLPPPHACTPAHMHAYLQGINEWKRKTWCPNGGLRGAVIKR